MRKAPQTPLLHATKLSAEQIEGWAMPASSMADGYLLPGSDSRKTSWNKKPFPRSLRIDNCVPHKAETGFPLTNKHWESPAHLQQHSIHPLAPRLYAAKSLDSLGYLAQPQQENLSSPSSARGLNMANAEPGGISCEAKASSIPPPRPPARRDSLGAARHHEMQPSLGMSTGRGAVLAVWSVGPVHKVTSGPVRPNEPQFAEAQAGLQMDAVALQAKEVQNKVPQPTMTIKSSPAGNVELKPVGYKDAFSHSVSLSVYSPIKDGSADKDLYHSRTSETCSPALLSTVVCRSAAQSTESIGFFRGHGHLQGDACLDTNQASKENAPQNYVQSHDVTLLDLNLPNSEIPVGQLSNAVFLTEEETSDTQGKLICNAANVCFGNAEPHTRALHIPSGHSANLASKESYVNHMQGTHVKISHQKQNEDILYEDTGRSLSLQTCLPETVSAKLLEIYTKAQRRRSSSDVSFSEQNNSHLDEGSKWIVPSSTCMSNKQQLGEQRSFSTDSVISAAETPILHHLTRGQTGRVYMQNDLTVHAYHHPTGRSQSADILLEEDGEHEDEVESTDGQDTQKYRESLKQAQGRVLRETSFRRNDLKIGLVRKGQTFNTDSNQQERQKLWWNRQWSTSKQHEPKERKSVHPDTRVPSNMESTAQGYNSHFRSPRGQTLQRLHAAARQCSYSEPAKMHEVGRMGTGIMRPIPAQSRPQLKAVQQSALQRFLQRKTGRLHHSEEVDENLSPASNHGQQLMNRQWEMEGEQRGNTRACMISCNMSSPEGAHSFASFPEKSHRAYVSEINLSSLPLDSLVGKRQQWLVAESGQGLKAKNNMSDAQTGSALQSANNRNRCGLSRESEKASSLEDLLERSSPTCEYLHTRSSSSPSPNCTIVEPPCDIATVSKKSVPCVSSHQFDKSLRERSASCNQNDTHMQSDLRYHQLNQLYKRRDIADKLCPDKRGHQNLTTHKGDTPLIFERVRLDNDRPASDRLWGCRSAESLIEATSGPVRQNSFALSGSIKSQTITTEGSVAAEDTLFPQYHHNKTLKCEHSNTPCTTNPTLCSTSKSPTQNDSVTEKHAAISSPQLQSLKNTQQPVFLAATASLEIPQRNLQAVPCTTTSRTQTDSQNNFSVSVSPTQPPRSSKVLSLHSCSSREDDDVFMDEPASSIALPDCLPAREDNFGKEMEIKGNKAEALPKNVGGEILDRNQSSPLNTRHDTTLISESSMQSGQEHKLIQGQSDHSAQDVFMLDLLIKLTAADDSFTELLENEKSMIGILEMAAEIFPDYNEFCSLSMDSLPKGSIMQSYKIANDHASQDDSNKETTENLTSVKRELISNLTTHVKHLQSHKSQLQAQATEACMLGETLEKAVHQNCRSTDFEKYKQLMKDLDMVVNLLLSICGRLARVESAISCLPKSTEPSQKQGMSRKQLDLQGKLEDARELQRDLKIRETTMAGLLANSLSPSQLKDYHHLIGLKASVLITQRHLEESLQSAEFQLDVLHNNSTSEEQATPKNLLET